MRFASNPTIEAWASAPVILIAVVAAAIAAWLVAEGFY